MGCGGCKNIKISDIGKYLIDIPDDDTEEELRKKKAAEEAAH